jgi:hypothetical protein
MRKGECWHIPPFESQLIQKLKLLDENLENTKKLSYEESPTLP